MARQMADSTNPFDIPRGRFAVVAGYVDGDFAWPAAGWQFHSDSALVRIAVFPSTDDGMVLDIERFDASPAQAPGWVRMRLAAGQYPTIYVNRSNVGPSLQYLHDAGLDGQFGVWLAVLDCTPGLAPGTYATQWASTACSGGHYDISDVADYWPGLDALPPPPGYAGSAGAISGWSGVSGKVDFDLPAFANELGVLSSDLLNLG